MRRWILGVSRHIHDDEAVMNDGHPGVVEPEELSKTEPGEDPERNFPGRIGMHKAVPIAVSLLITAVAAGGLAGEPAPLRVVQRAPASSSISSSAGPTTKSSAAPQPAILDINTATADQLKALPGMGPEYARRIIAGRPYSSKNQLVSRGVLPQPAYAQISERIVARRPK